MKPPATAGPKFKKTDRSRAKSASTTVMIRHSKPAAGEFFSSLLGRLEHVSGQLIGIDLDDLSDARPSGRRRNIDGRRNAPVGGQHEIADRLIFGGNLIVARGANLIHTGELKRRREGISEVPNSIFHGKCLDCVFRSIRRYD